MMKTNSELSKNPEYDLFFSTRRNAWGMRVTIGEDCLQITFHSDLCKLMQRFSYVDTFRVEKAR